MSNQEFENYVALIGKLLQLTREQRDQISGELQDHLQMRVADLVSEGVAKQDAVAKALEEFGDAAVMAKNFQTVMNLKRRRWMMRFATISIAGAFLAAVLTMALWPDNARFGAPGVSLAQDKETPEAQAKTAGLGEVNFRFSDGTQRDLKTEEALKQVVDLDFMETPMDDIIGELREMTGLNFLLDSSATDDQLYADEPMTFLVKQLPLNKCLELMLAQKNATYMIDEGVVVFISQDIAQDAEYMRLKMFDCRTLLGRIPASSYKFGPVGGGPGGGGFGGGGGGGGITGESGGGMGMGLPSAGGGGVVQSSSKIAKSSPASPSDFRYQEQKMLDLVFSMVNPDSWQTTGQGMATADFVNGILVVRQTESGIRKVGNLLADLEANVLPADMIRKAKVLKSGSTKQVKLGPAKTTRKDPFGNSNASSIDQDVFEGARKNPFDKAP